MGLTELLTKGGYLGDRGSAAGAPRNGDMGSHPYKHSNMITPRDHQSHENV